MSYRTPPASERDRVLRALATAGGAATMGWLERELGVHKNTVRKHLRELIDEGAVESVAHGRYRLRGGRALSSDSGNELLEALEEAGYDAHITGFDLLAPHAHQFVFQYPHLVYAEPGAFEALEFDLPNRGFVVVPAGPGPGPSGPDTSRLVVLRRQASAAKNGVHGHLAPVEKAWVDALRETLKGNLDLPLVELGRILRSLVESGADVRYLRRYARRLGYLERVDGAIGGSGAEVSIETEALRAGFAA
jgi:DNA-binding MarR family transcriptional regulator